MKPIRFFLCRNFFLTLGLAMFAAAPAHAYTVATSAGTTTTTGGAVTFADFDIPTTVDPAYATITGGVSNGGTFNVYAGGNWIASDGGSGSSIVVINLTGMADYFGLYWGTNDGANNVIKLYNGASLVGTVLGQGGPDAFWNVTASSAAENFNRVELSTPFPPHSGCCFEVDNLATRIAAVPEPLSGALLGVGLAAMGFSRRRKA